MTTRIRTSSGTYALTDQEERFWTYVKKTPTCWLWTGGFSTRGYGRFWANGKTRTAHRIGYELLVGTVPAGLTLDHLCRNRACVNPAHLEPVTNRENILRGRSPSAIHARKTHCPHGHPYDEANTRRRADGSRDCRTCWGGS